MTSETKVEKVFAPHRVRPEPRPQVAAQRYRLFHTWVRVEPGREVMWFNNLPLTLGAIKQLGATIPEMYGALDAKDFGAFEEWVTRVGVRALDIQGITYACDVVGKARCAFDDTSATVSFRAEDILLHWAAYERVSHDLLRAKPDWIPFFFRGGIPLGLAVLGRRIAEGRTPSARPKHVQGLTWLPGLGHLPEDCGGDPKEIFLQELEIRRRSRATCPLRVWVLDVTFTGSSMFGNLQNALGRVLPSGVPVDVTVAAIVPVEDNVKKRVHMQADAIDLRLKSSDGRPAFLKPIERPAAIRSLSVRVYPVAKSLTEDVKAALELSYGEPAGGKPVYVRGLCQDLALEVTFGDRKASRHLGEGGQRNGDTVHDWFFSAFNKSNLVGVLTELGLPADPKKAVREILKSEGYAQYAGGPICFNGSHGLCSKVSMQRSHVMRFLSRARCRA